MDNLINRQAAINTEGLEEEIRCEMCKNPMHTNKGCDGNCKYDEKLYERIIQILDKRTKPLPSAQSEYYDYSDIDDVWEYYAEEQDINLTSTAKQLKDAMWVGYRKGKQDAQSEQQWIPVSERLPKVAQRVLLSGHGQVIVGMLHSFGKYSLEPTGISYVYPKDDIEAWMPLPEPWRGEQDETDRCGCS